MHLHQRDFVKKLTEGEFEDAYETIISHEKRKELT